MSIPALDGGCAQGAFGRAGFIVVRSANLRTAATLLILSDSVSAPLFRALNHGQKSKKSAGHFTPTQQYLRHRSRYRQPHPAGIRLCVVGLGQCHGERLREEFERVAERHSAGHSAIDHAGGNGGESGVG